MVSSLFAEFPGCCDFIFFSTFKGVTVQWIMGSAIFSVGLILNCVEGFPAFYPLAMLSGAIWAFGEFQKFANLIKLLHFWHLGNITAVPIIRCIGMGMGVLLWSASSLVIGWASGR